MNHLIPTFKQGVAGWRKLILPTKGELLTAEFARQRLDLPPPLMLQEMLNIDFPDWPMMCRVLSVFWGAVPTPRGIYFVPAYQRMSNARQTLSKMLNMLEDDAGPEQLQHRLVRTLYKNAKELSEKRGHKDGLMHPWEFAGTDEELIRGFLRSTPFYKLFHHGVNYEFPLDQRMVHTTLTAAAQSGKTYKMKTQILADALRDNPFACIVIDPKDDVWAPERGKGALWEHLARTRALTNKVLITADDLPGMNPFDVGAHNFAHLYDSYEYFFAAVLEQELSPLMKTMLRHVLALCLKIPNATLDTMRDVLRDITPFKGHFAQLQQVDREYFESEFTEEKKGREQSAVLKTRDALRQRINGMRASELGPMFRAERNMIQMRQWIDERKTIIVHASPNKFGKQFKAFGRWFIAEALRAARSRRTVHPCMLYVDEAASFFDENTALILEYMATSNFAGFFAFQQWDQAVKARVDSAMGNARVKIFGGHDDDDLRHFRETFYPDRRGVLDPLQPGNFYARVSGKPAFTIQVPKLTNDFMTDEEYAAFRAANKALLTSSPPAQSRQVDIPKQPPSSRDDVDE